MVLETPFDEKFYVGDLGDSRQIVKNSIVLRRNSCFLLHCTIESVATVHDAFPSTSDVDRSDLPSDEVPIRPF